MKRIFVPLLVLALLCICLPASADGNIMKFDNQASIVFENETLQTILLREGVPAEGELSFSSGSEKIATVDSNGVVTGVSKGRTTITAFSKTPDRTYKAQLTVTVARKAQSVEVDTRKLVTGTVNDPMLAGLLKADGEDLPVLLIPVKKQINLQINVLPQDATNRRAVLSSGDESVLAVRGTNISGKAVGETVLTVANELSPEVNTRFRVLVVQPVTRVNLTPAKPVVAAGSQVSLSASILPEDASIKQIVWSSSNEEIATVDANGVVTGVKKGNVRIVASSTDGANIRANINVRVTQSAEEIVLKTTELTVNVGRNAVLRVDVLPKNADDKNVVWASSDESVAKVDNRGRVTGVSAGTCQITCSSASAEGVSAAATVNVQIPVTKITFGEVPVVYVDESTKLEWTVEPADATNPGVTFEAGNKKVLSVAEDGTVTGLQKGESYVTAVSADGSNRRARILVKVRIHATGVHMRRQAAYINKGATTTCTAVLEPKGADDTRMTWISEDESIATVSGNANKVKITGKSEGTTRVVGKLEDGGFETSILVHIGHWDKSVQLTNLDVNGRGDVILGARNVSELNITTVTCEAEFFDGNYEPIPVNTKDGSNKVQVVYSKTLEPGKATHEDRWVFKDYAKSEMEPYGRIVVHIVSFQIDNDWIKDIRENNRPMIEWGLVQ